MGSARSQISRLMLICLLLPFLGACRSTQGEETPVSPSATVIIEENDPVASNPLNESSSITTGNDGQQPQSGSESTSITANSSPATVVPGTPEISPLQLVNQGFSQVDRQVAYAFVVENLNQETAISDSKYQVTAYDSTGVNLASDSEFLALLLPDQRLGIAGNLFLEQSTPVALVTVRLETGQPVIDFSSPSFDVSKIRYWQGQQYDRVTAIVSNKGSDDLEQLRLAALAFDSQESIVGAGHVLLNFLPAGQETGIDITLNVIGEVDHIELFPRISPLTSVSSDAQIQISGNRLSLLDIGFSQLGIEVLFGFLIINRNLTFALEDSLYRLTVFNETGEVIAVQEGQIDLILPGQTLGLGGSLFIDNDISVDKIDVIIQNGMATLTPPLPLFEVEDLTIIENEGALELVGEVINPYNRPLENISLTAILFDADGRITGGHTETLDLLPASGALPVDMNILSSITPATVQLFASAGALAELR